MRLVLHFFNAAAASVGAFRRQQRFCTDRRAYVIQAAENYTFPQAWGHAVIPALSQLFSFFCQLLICTICITVGKSWYYYPLQIVTIFCALIQFLPPKEIRPGVFKNEFEGKTKKLKRKFPLFGGIFESLPLNYNFLVMQYWNSTFFLTKDIHGLFPQHAFSGAILFFVCHEVLSFQCARACVKSVSSAGFYVLSLSLSLSPFFYLSLTLFFWALTPLHNAKCPLRSSQVFMSEIMKSRHPSLADRPVSVYSPWQEPAAR